jgi:nucleoside-diphosphate-sugar epimerase
MIYVTGATGFLGASIVRFLHEQDIKVKALVREESNCWRLSDLPANLIFRGDVDSWCRKITVANPTCVVSADWNGVDLLSRDQELTQLENVDRILKIARASQNSGVKKFIALGSQAELGKRNSNLTEVEPDAPENAYGYAKVILRKNLEEIFKNSNSELVWARIFSVYGPLELGESFMALMMKSLSDGIEFQVLDADRVWSYLYIADFASAIVELIFSPEVNSVVNVGNPLFMTIKEVVNLANEVYENNFGSSPRIIKIKRTEGDFSLMPEISTLSELGWAPKISMRSGIGNTLKWHFGLPVTMIKNNFPPHPKLLENMK